MRHFAPPAVLRAGGTTYSSSAGPNRSERLALLDASSQGIFVVHLDGRLAWFNAEAIRRTEVTDPSSVIGRPWLDFWPPEEQARVAAAIRSALTGVPAGFTAACPTARRAKALWEVLVVPGGPSFAGEPTLLVFVQDVTERELALEGLRWAANHDGLTGLANRTCFYRSLRERIEGARDGAGSFALVAFDLDRFKQINERFGHAGGDALLQGFAARLADIAPVGAITSRFGGDEFVLLMDISPGAQDARSLVESMLARLALPYQVAGQAIKCTASAGIAVFPDTGRSADELYMNADLALLAGKAEEPGRAVMFSGKMRQALQRRASALEVAAAAIANDWIEPHYQPKFDLATGKLCGLEALLRWRRPGGSWQSPATIAAAFEDKRLATKITDIVMRKVVDDLSLWRRNGCAVPVAINVSEADLQNDDFAERLLVCLEGGSIPPSLIELEITEGVFLGDGAARVARALRKLSDAGVRIALDDFGTGYASLSHLKQFPVHVIKIDRSFVSNLASSHEDRAIVRTMIDLGKSMSIEVVAEGVESEVQLSFLHKAGCHIGQGFLFSRAISAAEVEARHLRRSGLIGCEADVSPTAELAL